MREGRLLWSFAYLAVRGLLALVLLLGRSRRSKELEISVFAARVGCSPTSGCSAEVVAGGSCFSGCVEPLVAARGVGLFLDEAGDVVGLAPPACRSPRDVREYGPVSRGVEKYTSFGRRKVQSLSGGRDVEAAFAQPVALALERDHGGVVDEPVDEGGGDHRVAEDLACGVR